MRYIAIAIALLLFQCSSYLSKHKNGCNDCPDPATELTEAQFLAKSKNVLRSDDVILNRVTQSFDSLSKFIGKHDSLFGLANECVIRLEILPNGRLRFKNYRDTLTLDTATLREANLALDNVRYDSIPSYNSNIEIKLLAYKTKNAPTFSQNYSLQYIGAHRTKMSILCVVCRYISALRYAYNRRLKEVPGLSGKVTIKFAIDDTGRVIFCQVIGTTMHDSVLENILVEKIKCWKFENIFRPHDVTEVVYPFIFSQ